MKGVRPDTRGRGRLLWRSFAAKLVLLLGVFIAVPIVLYAQFRTADAERTALLLKSVQEEGRLIALGLRPLLEQFDGRSVNALTEGIERFGIGQTNVKLLFRPTAAERRENFYYVASSPAVSVDYLEEEREELAETGVLAHVRDSCEGQLPASVRYTNPAGEPEIVTSIVPVNVEAGCWVVVTSHATPAFIGSSIGRSYWETPEVRIAAAIYVLMAAIVIWLFADAWRSLRRFQRLAREIRTQGAEDVSFAALNRVPELEQVAEEFDRLVHALGASGRLIRQAAEENVHALKAPLAVISQSIEPLKRTLPQDDAKGRRALDLIEGSVVKLDNLLSAARRMDEAIAELINPPRQSLDMSGLVETVTAAYAESWKDRELSLDARIERGVGVVANADLLETALDNVLDNAQSFSPAGGRITVELSRSDGFADLTIEDEGPGVAAKDLDRIFERYFSERPLDSEVLEGFPAGAAQGGHSGIGLWIVRRNIEAFGGEVGAENRATGGLRVTLRLPSDN